MSASLAAIGLGGFVKRLAALAFLATVLIRGHAAAASFELFEVRLKPDLPVLQTQLWSQPFGFVVDFDGLSFDADGLPTLTAEVIGAGSHYVTVLFDLDIDTQLNGRTNEIARVANAAAAPAGLLWEVGEQGNTAPSGFIRENGPSSFGPADVALALGWRFDLAADEAATVTFVGSRAAPDGGFFLVHEDPNSIDAGDFGAQAFFTSRIEIRTVPEPSAMLLIGTGLIALRGWRQRCVGDRAA
jgi:hypothetical protein